MENLPDYMQLPAALFDSAMSRAEFAWVLAGCGFILCGIILMGLTGIYRIKGQHVTLKVIGLHEEEQVIKETDDETRIAEKKANPMIRPEFEVMDGPHQGTRAKSSSGGTDHTIGETLSGYFIPQSGDIVSLREHKIGARLGFGLVAIGGVILIAVKVLAHSWAS